MRGGRKEGRSLVEPGPPPRVRLSETGMREAGTEPRPFHSTRCLNRGDKRAGRTAAASPLGRSSGSGTETLRRRWGGGRWKMAPPAGEGPVPPHGGRGALPSPSAARRPRPPRARGGAEAGPPLRRFPPPPLPARRCRRSPRPLSRPPRAGAP